MHAVLELQSLEDLQEITSQEHFLGGQKLVLKYYLNKNASEQKKKKSSLLKNSIPFSQFTKEKEKQTQFQHHYFPSSRRKEHTSTNIERNNQKPPFQVQSNTITQQQYPKWRVERNQRSHKQKNREQIYSEKPLYQEIEAKRDLSCLALSWSKKRISNPQMIQQKKKNNNNKLRSGSSTSQTQSQKFSSFIPKRDLFDSQNLNIKISTNKKLHENERKKHYRQNTTTSPLISTETPNINVYEKVGANSHRVHHSSEMSNIQRNHVKEDNLINKPSNSNRENHNYPTFYLEKLAKLPKIQLILDISRRMTHSMRRKEHFNMRFNMVVPLQKFPNPSFYN